MYKRQLHLKEERGYKPASRRRLAATLKGFFKWAYKHGYIDVDLAETVPSIKVPDNERHFLSPEEVKTWVDAVDHDVSKVAIWIMYYAGLRINEATNLRMDDVQLDEDGGWLIVRRGKGGKYRRVPIAPALAEILRDYICLLYTSRDVQPGFDTYRAGNPASGDAYRGHPYPVFKRPLPGH